MPVPPWDENARLILSKLEDNDEKHRELHAMLAEIRASQAKIEMDVKAHTEADKAAVKARKLPFWVQLVAGGLSVVLVAVGGWSARGVSDHESRLAVIEAHQTGITGEMSELKANQETASNERADLKKTLNEIKEGIRSLAQQGYKAPTKAKP